jgi:hypothetical protein
VAQHAYVDESFEAAYLMAVIAVEGSDVAATRSRARQLRAPGAARFHMSSEGNARRNRALALIGEISPTVLVIEVSAETPPHQRRARAMESVVNECLGRDAARVVFELDVSVIGRDRRTVAHALRAYGDAAPLAYDFIPGASEPLLWLPDAVAWAWARGGHWRRRLPEGLVHIRA